MATMRSKSCLGNMISFLFLGEDSVDTYTNGLDESEAKNGVGEKLALERWVACDGHEEGSKDETDTNTSL